MVKVKIMLALVPLMASVTAGAEHWPTGYYGTVADPENVYYYNDEYRWFCHIQNQTQAGLYDVESQVRIVGDVDSILSQAISLQECPWPNGFYTIVDSEGPVYRLYPGNKCTITSEEMLAAYGGTDYVIYAEEGSDFGAQRTELGQCFWPSYDELNFPVSEVPLPAEWNDGNWDGYWETSPVESEPVNGAPAPQLK